MYSKNYFKNLIQEIKSYKNKLYVFDFDDTLVKTDAMVGITNRNAQEKRWITPGEYAIYDKHQDDVFDFDQFDQLINPQSINWVKRIFSNVYNKKGPGSVAILTARGHASREVIQNFLKDIGYPGIQVVTLQSSNPQDKADWIEQQIMSQNLDFVEFFDDSHKNVKAVEQLQLRHPEVRVISRHVVHRNH